MLEATDKALASVIDAMNTVAHQISPDVLNSVGQVAMLSAQGTLITAHIMLWVAGLVFLIAIALLFGATSDSSADGLAGCGGFFLFVALVIFGWNICDIYSPLVQARANDPKIALTYEMLRKIDTDKK